MFHFFRISNQNPASIYILSHACHVPYQSRVLWLDQRNIFKKRNWWKSLLFNLFNLPYFLPLSTKYLSQLPVLQNHLHSLSVRNEILHPHKIIKITVPVMFFSSFITKMWRQIFWN
jgi:hypothetical protein